MSALPLSFPMGSTRSASFLAATLWMLTESPWASSCREKFKLEKNQSLRNQEKKKMLITLFAYVGAPFLPNFSAYLCLFAHSSQNLFTCSDHCIARKRYHVFIKIWLSTEGNVLSEPVKKKKKSLKPITQWTLTHSFYKQPRCVKGLARCRVYTFEKDRKRLWSKGGDGWSGKQFNNHVGQNIIK